MSILIHYMMMASPAEIKADFREKFKEAVKAGKTIILAAELSEHHLMLVQRQDNTFWWCSGSEPHVQRQISKDEAEQEFETWLEGCELDESSNNLMVGSQQDIEEAWGEIHNL